jgi:hypothetical protein
MSEEISKITRAFRYFLACCKCVLYLPTVSYFPVGASPVYFLVNVFLLSTVEHCGNCIIS